MDNEYRLYFTGLENAEKQFLNAYAIPYGYKGCSPKERRYFYAVREQGGTRRRICFIKLQNGEEAIDQRRAEIERLSGCLCSPYIVAQFRQSEMSELELKWKSENGWVRLPGQVLLFEYFPMDLEQFWTERVKTANKKRLLHDRGQILVKLIEAVGYLNQQQLFHCDIKPHNIMINCFDLCEDAKWCSEELDVKLTDFDCAQNGRVAGARFYTGTPPFQPTWKHAANTWLDLYSICMIALWLFCREDQGDYDVLYRLSNQQCQSEEDIYAILRSGKAEFPKKFLEHIVPFILRSTQGILENGASAGIPAKDLVNLSRRLQEYFFRSLTQRPMELLEPSGKQQDWSAILQIDQDYWPIFGRGRDYRAFSFSECAGNHPGQRRELYQMGELPESSVEHISDESKLGQQVLSAPPEICVAYEGKNFRQSSPSLKAGIFASVLQEDERTFKAQCLAERRGILRGGNALLYQEKNSMQSWDEKSFFDFVRIFSVDFYDDPLPKLLPVCQNRRVSETKNMNVLFLISVSGRQNMRNPICELLLRVINQASALEGCHPCYYGMTILRQDTKIDFLSFCNGKYRISGKAAVQDFCMSAQGRLYRDEADWRQSGKDNLAFSPERPTVAICFFDRPLSREEFKEVGQALLCLSGAPLYAADYLQVFLPLKGTDAGDSAWESRWEPMLPMLNAAVRPGGPFIVTPLNGSGRFTDQDIRCLDAICRCCGQIPNEKAVTSNGV